MSQTDRPLCLVVLPENGADPPDFDAVYEVLRAVLEADDFECRRASLGPGPGLSQRSLRESLLLAECVVADTDLADPEVAFLLGARQGASNRPTLWVSSAAPAEQLEASLRERVTRLKERGPSIENPLLYATRLSGSDRLEHDKTDVFLTHFDPRGSLGRRIREALDLDEASEAVTRLSGLEKELFSTTEAVDELDSSLLAIYLGYRERKAYQEMVDLAPRMPLELRRTAVVQEQRALALNRLAEQAERDGRKADGVGSAGLRKRALACLDLLPPDDVTSETWAIRGRIHKAHYEAQSSAGNESEALAALERAIESYERGLRADLRDYYPGVNAVTLRFLRGRPEDLAALESLVPVVRMAVDNAPTAESGDELYWQSATRMELACAARDWPAAREHLAAMKGVGPAGWMLETTSRNLGIQLLALKDEPESVTELLELVQQLSAR